MLAVRALDPAWNPLNRQVVEADTTFLYDPAADSAAGLIAGTGAVYPPRNQAAPPTAAGKFRTGVASTSSLTWMSLAPGVLPPAEFTVEFWAACATGDFTSVGTSFFTVGNVNADYFQVSIGSAKVTVTLHHTSTSPTGVTYTAQSAAIASGTYPQNTFVNLAVTLLAGTLTLYINGVQAAQATGVTPPVSWGGDGFNDSAAFGPLNFILSDLRISRKARIPNRQMVVAPSSSTFTVGASTGATVQPLNGALHDLPGNASGDAHNPPSAADAIQIGTGALHTVRTDKLITVTPIKVGAVDGTHPTLGHSGSYSYDWQVVDRSIGYIINTLGCEPYISLDAGHQLFGGSSTPFSGTSLTQGYARASGYDAAPPNDFAGYATVCADLIYHLMVEKGWTQCQYYGLWNEPSGSWGGTPAQYFKLWGQVGTAIRAMAAANSLTIKFGGPEHGGGPGSAFTTWVQGLINFCGTLQAGPTLPSASAQAGGYSGSRTFNGAQQWFYKFVARNGAGNSVASGEVTATPATGGSVLLGWTMPVGGATVDIYAASTSGAQNGATSLLASGVSGTSYTDTGAALTTGAVPSAAAANGAQIDFISWHFYDGRIFEHTQVSAAVAAWCPAAGVPVPPLFNGEWSFDIASTGFWPFKQPHSNGAAAPAGFTDTGPIDFFYNDWMAGFAAANLIQMQNNGVIRSILCDPGNPGTVNGSIFSSNAGVAQVAYNVMRMWSMIVGNTVYALTAVSDPGVFALASKNTTTGKVYVLLASVHYRKTANQPVLVKMPAGVTNGATVTTYLVDDTHSNQFDAGSANAALQTGATTLGTSGQNVVSGGQVGISLRPRAAALLVIG